MSASGENTERGLTEFFFFGILLVAAIVGLWFALRQPIMWISFYTSYYCFLGYEHLGFLMTDTELKNIIVARKAIPSINPTKFGFVSLLQLFEYHGYVWRWVFCPMLIWLGWRTKKGVKRFQFRRKIKNVYDLIDIQAKHFPASAIIKGKNLLSTHLYDGPWATYTLPLDFALDHKLLWTSKKRVAPDAIVDRSSMIPIPAFTPDEKLQIFPVKRKKMPHYSYVLMDYNQANDVFSKQLGTLWADPDKLPPLEKALFAVFCTQAAGEQGRAWELIEQLAFSFKEGTRNSKGKLISPHYANTEGVDELIKKYANTPAMKAVYDTHAHTVCVLTAALKLARKKGRLMHSNFLWLKPVNRTLWYALCAQGGQSAYWEAAGPFAHQQIEELLSKKIATPMVFGAVNALRDLLSKEHWIDPGEYSEEAQQRLVAEANSTLERATHDAKESNNAFAGNNYRASRRKRTEDDTP